MHSKGKYVAPICVLWSLILPGSLCADIVYTYTSSSVNISFDLTSSPDNIPSGTNIGGGIVPGSFSMTYPGPATDTAGFPLGPGSGFSLSTLLIGTDSVVNITSWDISGSQFSSYPAVGGENPKDFFCTYSVSFTAAGGSGPLTQDHDEGLCPGSDDAVADGTWSPQNPISEVPEPHNSALLGGGCLGLLVLVTRHKRAAIAR